MNDWIKSNRLALQAQAQQFSDGISTLGSGLGLSTGEISGFAGTLGSYNTDMANWVAAKAAADALYETFMVDKKSIETLMRKYNKRMQSAAGINNAKREEIGIPIPVPASAVVPKTVTNLVASLKPNGDIRLKWKRSGNAQNVIFVVETSTDGGEYTFLANVTGISTTLTGFTPGAERWFRVVSTRGTLTATPSSPVVVYAAGEEQSFLNAA